MGTFIVFSMEVQKAILHSGSTNSGMPKEMTKFINVGMKTSIAFAMDVQKCESALCFNRQEAAKSAYRISIHCHGKFYCFFSRGSKVQFCTLDQQTIGLFKELTEFLNIGMENFILFPKVGF